MREDIRRNHGYNKIKDVFIFDDALAEIQASFILPARPILPALTATDRIVYEEEEEEAPDPDLIKGMLKDTLVLLGNADVRLSS